nr:MAG TPA: hypothetical protein [Bacteriophage sp.]
MFVNKKLLFCVHNTSSLKNQQQKRAIRSEIPERTALVFDDKIRWKWCCTHICRQKYNVLSLIVGEIVYPNALYSPLFRAVSPLTTSYATCSV